MIFDCSSATLLLQSRRHSKATGVATGFVTGRIGAAGTTTTTTTTGPIGVAIVGTTILADVWISMVISDVQNEVYNERDIK